MQFRERCALERGQRRDELRRDKYILDNLSLSCDDSGEKAASISGKMGDDEKALGERKTIYLQQPMESNLGLRSD